VESIGPILLEPILKHRAWGGRKLLDMGKHPPADAPPPFGESWELADLPSTIADARSRIRGGPFDGVRIGEAIERAPEAIMGIAPRSGSGRFPLLIKFIDAAQNLSIQVHPHGAHARRHPEAQPKCEAWFILHAEPDAVVYRGVDPSITRPEFEARVASGRLLDALIQVPARVGDCLAVPSGLCHALGAGILAVEVQTPSDTTYRLWDWDRRTKDRPLQIEDGLECVRLGDDQSLDDPAPVNALTAPSLEAAGLRTVRLCRTHEFEIELIESKQGASLEVITDDMPVIWVNLDSPLRLLPPLTAAAARAHDRPRATAASTAAPVEVGRFTTVLLPAASQGWSAQCGPSSRFIRVTLPHRMSRMLADHD